MPHMVRPAIKMVNVYYAVDEAEWLALLVNTGSMLCCCCGWCLGSAASACGTALNSTNCLQSTATMCSDQPAGVEAAEFAAEFF